MIEDFKFTPSSHPAPWSKTLCLPPIRLVGFVSAIVPCASISNYRVAGLFLFLVAGAAMKAGYGHQSTTDPAKYQSIAVKHLLPISSPVQPVSSLRLVSLLLQFVLLRHPTVL